MKKWDQLKNFFLDKNKKSWTQILKEALDLWKESGKFPLHYFTRYAYRKDAGNFRDYIEVPLAKKIWKSNTLHNVTCCELLRDKLAFHKFARENGIRTPEIICNNVRDKFIFENTSFTIDNNEKFIDLVRVKIKQDIFIKPKDGIQGRGVFKVLIDTVDDKYLSEVFNAIKQGDFIFQKLINQHPSISQLNATSVNTLRIDTYKDNEGVVHILTPFIRLGLVNSITDNTSTKGFIVPIDLNRGVFNKFGIQYLSVGTEFLSEHPNSRVKFEGLSVPYANEIKEIVIKVAGLVEDRLVGWDVAICDDGPVVVEGNCDYAMAGQDIIVKGYKRHPIFRRMLIEHDLL